MACATSLHDLRLALRADRDGLVQHPLYTSISTLEDVQVFMEHHIFAVWDFMSLLKSLQRELSCVEVPWTPCGAGVGRRLVNEIVLGEESDEGPGGGYTSHFELYRAAMLEAGADVSRVDALVARIRVGDPLEEALLHAEVPLAARHFVAKTFATIRSRSLPRIAAAFTLGREDIIPDMFIHLVEELSRASGRRLTLLRDYLERHIQVDGERHGPMAARLLEELCRDDEGRWHEAFVGAQEALLARACFWDAIQKALAGTGRWRPARQGER